MKNITILEENDIQLLKDNIEGMDKIVETLINQNSSMEYKDYIENLRKLNMAVDAIGCILEIWRKEETNAIYINRRRIKSWL